MRRIAAHLSLRTWVTTLLIVVTIYPLLSLLRASTPVIIPLSKYLTESIYFLISVHLVSMLIRVYNKSLSRKKIFRNRPGWQITMELVLLVFTTPLVSFLIYISFFPRYLQKGSDLRTMFLFTIAIFFAEAAYLFYIHLSNYLQQYKRVIQQQEKLKYEKMLAQFSLLQNQVSPHFLFNCLNDLSGMIADRPALAADVLKIISSTLRYIISSREKALVTLRDELAFLDNYLFLQLLRFPGRIRVALTIEEGMKDKMLPPAILQMLVENAIKHNRFSDEEQLNLKLRSAGQNWIEISNNITGPRTGLFDSNLGIGLNNIRERYSYLTDQPVLIDKNPDFFSITIPLILNENNESTDY